MNADAWPSAVAVRAQAIHRVGEEAADPLAMEPAFGIRLVAARVRREVRVEAREVDAGDGDAAAALETAGRLLFVGEETVEAGAHERAEARLRRIVPGEVLALERAREELLGQVLRVLGPAPPAQPDVDVDRAPVAARQRLVGRRPARGIGAARDRGRRTDAWREMSPRPPESYGLY